VLAFEGIGFCVAFRGGFVGWNVNIVESFGFIAHKGFAMAELSVTARGSVVGGFVFVFVLGGVIVGVVAFVGVFFGRKVFIGLGDFILGVFLVAVVAFGEDVVGDCVVGVVAVCITLRMIFLCDRAFNWPLRTKTVVLGSWCASIKRTVILELAIVFVSHMGHFRACGGTVVLRRTGRGR
jgi:hypothetical protein